MEFNLALFSITKNSTGTLDATAEASTIQFMDNSVNGISLRSPKTGIVERFEYVGVDRDRENDIIAWNFRAVRSICPVQFVRILND